MKPQKWAVGVLGIAVLSVSTAQSPLFEGGNPEAWVFDVENPGLQSIDTGQWLETFEGSGISLTGKQQALINNLADSRPPMQPQQPAVSLAGLSQASNSQQNPQNNQVLRVWPDSGVYDRTIRLEVGVVGDLLASQTSLTLNVQLDAQPFRSVVLCGTQSPPGCVPAQAVRDGYRGLIDHVIEPGAHTLSVELRDAANQQLAAASKLYQLDVADAKGRLRDSDGDGIPDLIERELGLDPLSGDRDVDRDGDGWTDFDEWLRGADADQRNDPNWVPVDTDGDGWSDWDEDLRGTRANDPDPQLTPRAGENTQTLPNSMELVPSESYLRRAQRFREFPLARRLYEVEYISDVAALTPRSGFNGAWQAASAQTLGGYKAWRQADLVDEELLSESALTSADLAASRLAAQAAQDLAAGRFPSARMPASEGLMLDVALRQADDTLLMHKHYLPAVVDADLPRFLATDPQWVDGETFRKAYIRWLEENLVQTWDGPLNWQGTRTALALELILSDEARLNAAAAPVVFNDRVDPVARLWLADFLKTLDRVGPQGGLNALVARLDSVLSGAGILRDVAAFIDEQLAADQMPAGVISDVYMAERFVSSFTLDDQDCFVSAEFLDLIQQSPSAWQQFSSRCPIYATEVDALVAADEDRARRYALRGLLLLEPSDYANDQSLLDPDADSDNDGRRNDQEVRAVVLGQTSQPDRMDSDEDGNPDSSDLCPRDLTDACLGLPSEPLLLSDLEPLAEEGDGAVAVVALHLDRAVSFEVTGHFSAQSIEDDSATPDVDYRVVTGSFSIAPGQQVAVITIPVILDDQEEGIETFSLLLSDIAGARSTIVDDRVIVSIADPDLGGPPADAPTAVATAPLAVYENAQVALDGQASLDPLAQGLSYQWTQLSGPTISLSQANSALATFVAPTVSGEQTVVVQLTVTDAENRSASDSASITVRPVDDPPEVLGTARFTVDRTATLSVQTAELTAYVNDPEGGALRLEQFLGQPAGGVFVPRADGFDFTPYQGEQKLTEDTTRQLQRAGQQHAVWLETVGSETALRVYSATTQSVRTQWQSGDLQDVLAASEIPVVYSLSSSLAGAPTWALEWVSNGERLELGELGVYTIQEVVINPELGDLYFCDTRNTPVWSRVDAETGQIQTSTTACSGSSMGYTSANRLGEFCFVEESRLYCARGSDVRYIVNFYDVATIITLASYPIYSRHDELLVPIPGNNNDYDLYRIDANDQISLLDHIDGSAGQRPVFAKHSNGSLIMGMGAGDAAQLLYWTGGAMAPVPITPAFAESVSRTQLGALIERDGQVYWQLAMPGNTFEVFAIDLFGAVVSEGTVDPVSLFTGQVAQGRPPWRIEADDRGVLVQTPSGNVPNCSLWHIDAQSQDVQTLLSRVRCDPAYVQLTDGLVYVRQDGAPDYHRPVFRFDGVPVTGVTSFAARIADPAGHTADLPIEITIEDAP